MSGLLEIGKYRIVPGYNTGFALPGVQKKQEFSIENSCSYFFGFCRIHRGESMHTARRFRGNYLLF